MRSVKPLSVIKDYEHKNANVVLKNRADKFLANGDNVLISVPS